LVRVRFPGRTPMSDKWMIFAVGAIGLALLVLGVAVLVCL
jgi:hypothetical protein